MSLGLLAKISLAIGIAFMIGAGISLFLNLEKDNRVEIAQYVGDNPLDATGDSLKVIVGYDFTTPAWYLDEWYGDPETKTWMLEQIPFPDSRDLLFLVPFWLLLAIISRFIWGMGMSWAYKLMIILAMFSFGTVLAWVAFKSVLYYLMVSGATSMGILEQVQHAREVISREAENRGAITWLLIITAINALILFKALMPKK